MENTQGLSNELDEALISEERIKDPYTQVSELMDQMIMLLEQKRSAETELSEKEIDEQLDKKHRLMFQITVENLDKMEEKAAEVRKRMLPNGVEE
ncbi:MAG: hypothetical protein L0J35_00150 [Tetragenococcus halophilus]|nr:hypothetical protein [Tetragenococcus halophilus]